MTVEDIIGVIASDLDGNAGFRLKDAGFKFCELADLGELYVKTVGGDVFCLTAKIISADDVEGWGIEFDL